MSVKLVFVALLAVYCINCTSGVNGARLFDVCGSCKAVIMDGQSFLTDQSALASFVCNRLITAERRRACREQMGNLTSSIREKNPTEMCATIGLCGGLVDGLFDIIWPEHGESNRV